MSLVAVSLLAGTANMIAHESVHIIRTVVHSTAAAPPSAAASKARSLLTAAIADIKTNDALALTVESYRQASLSRDEVDPSTGRSDFIDARTALQLAAVSVRSAQRETEIKDFLDRGESLGRLAQQRRHSRAAYSSHVESIASRLQSSMGGEWTLFGRVIARQSLIKMHDVLDSIRQHAPSILFDETHGGNLASLIADESQFSELLASSQSTLTGSEGADWVRGVREDFDALVTLRVALTALNSRYDQAALQFAKNSRALLREIAAASDASRLVQDRWSNLAGAAHDLPAPTGSSITETTLERSDPNSARLMALVTAFVMLIIVVISFFTVRSIHVPVRWLVKASNELAMGPARVRVPRGGIRELDFVARSFNDMSLRLESARRAYKEQQESLEEQVLQRTQKLQELAQQDPLTSLPNRRHLAALLDSALDRARRGGRHVGIYFLDIDNFKNINDSLGHAFGDRVLISVAERLNELARGFGFVARLGGDEFTVVYENAESINSIHELGWMLARAFHKLVLVDERELSISVSVGASIFPEHESSAEGLLRAADSALFRAKELGRSQLALFTPELTTSAAARFAIEQGLRRALERSEFELHYQPEINPATSEIAIMETLLRWRLPDGRLASPAEFLSVAEQSGLMSDINTWVLRTAVLDAARWFHGGWAEVRVAINISPRQLLDHRFVERLLALLRELRLPPRCIELELTEMVLQTGPATIAALRELQGHGLGIALDDFGTGYSSLTSMENLPLTRIKLDRSLVARIDTSTRSAAIARAVIDLCADLGLEVTAEGIERPEQLAWFRDKHGILVQGFLLSEAVSFLEFASLKAILHNKIQDLLLSMPLPARAGKDAPLKVKIVSRR
ncbi:MAG TPA: EAL domain-containing protein [Steroidobacteraceae bacterium]